MILGLLPRRWRSARTILAVAVVLLVTGCNGARPFETNSEYAARLGGSTGLQKVVHRTSTYQILAFRSTAQRIGGRLHVYLEGDGQAFVSQGGYASSDPTPRNPLALRLAIQDNSANAVVYLARPCQYVQAGPRESVIGQPGPCLDSANTRSALC